ITPFVVLLGWVTCLTAGHTKRITTNAIFLCAYAIGNFASPFAWKAQYQPRNHVPWALLTAAMFVSAVLLLVLRFYLSSINKQRDLHADDDDDDDVYFNEAKEDGTTVAKRIDRAFLDLTDILAYIILSNLSLSKLLYLPNLVVSNVVEPT
ncbi:hypothetical protein C8J56DRAFT_791534, partial [Mycena floridula]